MPTRSKPAKASRGGSKSNTARKKLPTGRAAIAAALSLKSRLGARSEYRIYPSIGIARIGDSKDSFIVGPEAPGDAPEGPFRGADKGIKPQAARFRIYRVDIDDNENEQAVEEVVPSSNTKIEWSVSLANRKAAGLQIGDTLRRAASPRERNAGLDRNKLVISASGSVAGANKLGPVLSGTIEFAKPNTSGVKVTDIELATLRTDDAGRLLVVGGPGKSDSPLNAAINVFSDNDGWYDSVSDGPVSATLQIGGQGLPVIPAWVVVTVPRYAPGIYGIVTWYDQAVSMARTGADGTFDQPRTTSFTHDIYPILKRADNLSAVHGTAHANGALKPLSDSARLSAFKNVAERSKVLSKLTTVETAAPGPQQVPPGRMPQLFSGANPDPAGPTWIYLSLTRYQMAHMENWAHGNFADDWTGAPPSPVPFDQIPVDRQAWALTEAALEACVGGSFYPGIEGTYDIARAETYRPEPNLRREFRIDPAHPAGFLTEKMALPWQADFADCGNFWWPSQRPDDVRDKSGSQQRWDRDVAGPRRNAHLNMVKSWSQLGFVVFDKASGRFVEDERTLGTEVA